MTGPITHLLARAMELAKQANLESVQHLITVALLEVRKAHHQRILGRDEDSP